MKLIFFCLGLLSSLLLIYIFSSGSQKEGEKEKEELYICAPWRETRAIFSWDRIVNAWYTLTFPFTFGFLLQPMPLKQMFLCWVYHWYDLGITAFVGWLFQMLVLKPLFLVITFTFVLISRGRL